MSSASCKEDGLFRELRNEDSDEQKNPQRVGVSDWDGGIENAQSLTYLLVLRRCPDSLPGSRFADDYQLDHSPIQTHHSGDDPS